VWPEQAKVGKASAPCEASSGRGRSFHAPRLSSHSSPIGPKPPQAQAAALLVELPVGKGSATAAGLRCAAIGSPQI
jgi:hypothetical protein